MYGTSIPSILSIPVYGSTGPAPVTPARPVLLTPDLRAIIDGLNRMYSIPGVQHSQGGVFTMPPGGLNPETDAIRVALEERINAAVAQARTEERRTRNLMLAGALAAFLLMRK